MSDRADVPAFPVADGIFSTTNGVLDPGYGMSLRDYFAAQALQAVPQPLSTLHDVQPAYDRVALHCYRMADAMLKARQA